MKPNGEELASFTGADGHALEDDPGRRGRGRQRAVERGVGAVLATLGGNGAVLVTDEGAWHAAPPPSRWSAPSVPATRACSAICWETSGDVPRPSG